MSRIVDIEPLLKKYDGMNEGTEFSPIHFINDLMALEQLLFTEKEELLRVGKGAVKARQGRFVIYDVDWLKENFYTTEEKIYGQPKQTCIEDYPTCTECEHYDKEKHYCPRFCQVIKDTLAEAQPSEDCISILNRIMEYTYGMLTAEKYGLQHLIKSMMDEMSGGGEDENSD